MSSVSWLRGCWPLLTLCLSLGEVKISTYTMLKLDKALNITNKPVIFRRPYLSLRGLMRLSEHISITNQSETQTSTVFYTKWGQQVFRKSKTSKTNSKYGTICNTWMATVKKTDKTLFNFHPGLEKNNHWQEKSKVFMSYITHNMFMLTDISLYLLALATVRSWFWFSGITHSLPIKCIVLL